MDRELLWALGPIIVILIAYIESKIRKHSRKPLFNSKYIGFDIEWKKHAWFLMPTIMVSRSSLFSRDIIFIFLFLRLEAYLLIKIKLKKNEN